jgi:hypothetical protein
MTTAYAPTEMPFATLRLATDDGDCKPTIHFISEADLIAELSSIKGARIVTIQTRTEPRSLAKHPETGSPNPYRGNVVKVSKVNGMIGWQYVSGVNRQRVREEKTADFEALPRKWRQRISGTPFVEHQGSMYLEMKVERSLGYQYMTLDGHALDAAEVEPYHPTRSLGRQGVEREVILRDYALSSIESLKSGGVTFILRRANETEPRDQNVEVEMARAA